MNENMEFERTVLTEEEFIGKVELIAARTCRGSEANFINTELADVTLKNKTIFRDDFSYSKLTNITFSGINFEGTLFNYAELENVTFYRCRLRRSEFCYAVMHNVRFKECWMICSSFDYAAGNAVYEQCMVNNMELHHTLAEITLRECAAGGIQIKYCPNLTLHAENCDLHTGEFVDNTLAGELKNCTLRGSDFSGSDCTLLFFNDCKMREINTEGSSGVEIASGSDEEFDLELDLALD